MSALAACALTASALPRTIRIAAVLAAAGELVGDKLPQTPSRLAPPGLFARLVLGATAGWIVGAREGGDRRVSAAVGLGAAAATTFAGARARGLLSERFGADLPGAVGEDVLALALAGSAVRAG
jgi:uncharacterized membrane protein